MKAKQDRNRREFLAKTYGHRYRRIYMPHGSRCFYCADVATNVDHCPALTSTQLFDEAKKRDWPPHYLLPACGECNRRLCARALFTPSVRAAYLMRKLDSEYERRFALWSEDEIAEMSKDFQRTIRARKAALELLGKRLRSLEQCAIYGDEWAHEWAA